MEPLSISALGSVAITEGIKFVYSQATELLKRWRNRKTTGAEPSGTIPVDNSDIVAGSMTRAVPDYDVVDKLHERLTELAVELGKYKDGLVETTPEVGVTVDKLRHALEAIYGQRITFRGEQREPTGTTISGDVRAELVLGLAVGADVGNVTGGARVEGTATVTTVETGGTVIGVRAQDIGR